MYNPSLRQEPRYEPAAVLPITRETSLLDWLRASNRLIFREKEEVLTEVLLDDVEISELMGDVDDGLYDYDLDDDLDLSDDDAI